MKTEKPESTINPYFKNYLKYDIELSDERKKVSEIKSLINGKRVPASKIKSNSPSGKLLSIY